MRRIVALTALLAALAAPAVAAEPRNAPDCRFEGARSYESFGSIRTFTTSSGLFGCLTDVGRAYKLDTGTLRARSSATRGTLFGAGDWVGFQTRDRSGRARASRAQPAHRQDALGATSAPVSALVVNHDGTLAWIARTTLHTKASSGDVRVLASDAAIDRRFLGLENDRGCAVTWKVAGEQRSSSIFCSTP